MSKYNRIEKIFKTVQRSRQNRRYSVSLRSEGHVLVRLVGLSAGRFSFVWSDNVKLKARLMDEAAMSRALMRISHEITEKNKGVEDVVLIGIRRRGVPISERIREIATLKVLGFYPNEAAHYVFRENLILTGAGAVFGLGLGVALHAFVMNAIKVDMMYFKPHISFLSFAVSIVITFVFAMIVNAIMRRRIDNIDMAGALKSIE
mgnify:CR=1 FL=1